MTIRAQFENENGITTILKRRELETGTDFNRRIISKINENPANVSRIKIMSDSGVHETINL